MKTSSVFLLSLIGICLLGGCQTPIKPQINNIATETTSTSIPSSTATDWSIPASLTPTSRVTPSPTPSLPPPVTPTRTPRPTLSPEEAEATILDLYENNGGCELPCWWGFIPGTTTWAEASAFLETIAANEISFDASQLNTYAEIIIPVPEDFYEIYPRQDYTIQDSAIEIIEGEVGFAPAYNLSILLEKFGEPSEIWMSTYRESPWPTNYLQVMTYFPQSGIVAVSDLIATSQGEVIQACFRPDSSLYLTLIKPDPNLTLQDVIQKALRLEGIYGDNPWMTLEDATGLSNTAFLQQFSKAENDLCLETPIDLWPYP